MAKIQLLSDIHTEHDRDWGDAFIESLDPSICDILVLAGDIGSANTYYRALVKIAQKYAPKPVVYVHGNHEFYGSDRLSVRAQMATLPSNVHWLDHSSVMLGGIEFLGGTGWFDQRAVNPALCPNFSDFHWIKDLHSWVWAEHAAFRKFLASQSPSSRKRILVMHHAPSYKAVLPRWQRSNINDFFFVDIEKEVVALAPAAVFHGHMHSGLQYSIGSTPVYANPRGYPQELQELPFDPNFVVEINP